mmetsp:Transcript_91668/g.243555  ORF Transcript_91668/g.243555 Transcript_91668/m.243555 type:complete len:203 (+) Transcript_91668:1172-1780(+)
MLAVPLGELAVGAIAIGVGGVGELDKEHPAAPLAPVHPLQVHQGLLPLRAEGSVPVYEHQAHVAVAVGVGQAPCDAGAHLLPEDLAHAVLAPVRMLGRKLVIVQPSASEHVAQDVAQCALPGAAEADHEHEDAARRPGVALAGPLGRRLATLWRRGRVLGPGTASALAAGALLARGLLLGRLLPQALDQLDHRRRGFVLETS